MGKTLTTVAGVVRLFIKPASSPVIVISPSEIQSIDKKEKQTNHNKLCAFFVRKRRTMLLNAARQQQQIKTKINH